MHSFATWPLRSNTLIFAVMYNAKNPNPANDPVIEKKNRKNILCTVYCVLCTVYWEITLTLTCLTWSMATRETLMAFFYILVFTMTYNITPCIIVLKHITRKQEEKKHRLIFQDIKKKCIIIITYIDSIWKASPKEIRTWPSNSIFNSICDNSRYKHRE